MYTLTFSKAETLELFEKAAGYDDFQHFCLERIRSLRKLKTHEECKGEHHCTTSVDGVCVVNQTTLDKFCGRKPNQCGLYFTKRSSTPHEYEALLEAAIRLKERGFNDLPVNESDLMWFEIMSMEIFNRAERIHDNEKADRDQTDDKQKGVPGRGMSKGDSTAFAWTPEQLAQIDEQRRRRAARTVKKQ